MHIVQHFQRPRGRTADGANIPFALVGYSWVGTVIGIVQKGPVMWQSLLDRFLTKIVREGELSVTWPCDGIDDFRALDLDIGAAYRPQLGWAYFRTVDNRAEVKVHGVRS